MRKLAIALVPLAGLFLAGCGGTGKTGKGTSVASDMYANKSTPDAAGATGASGVAAAEPGGGGKKGPVAPVGKGKKGPVALKDGKAAFDASNSKIDFVGTKPEGRHDGGFNEFTGTVELTPDGKGLSKVSVDINADSLWSDNPKLTGHLKSPDFFDIKRVPKVGFVSTKIQPDAKDGATYNVTGNLTLHGETKEITVPATAQLYPNTLALQSTFTIDRTQFGMTYGKGKVHDDVKITVLIGR